MDHLGIFGYLLAPLHLIVLTHNWLKKDNAVGFEISPKIRWTHREDYEVSETLGLEDEYKFADYN